MREFKKVEEKRITAILVFETLAIVTIHEIVIHLIIASAIFVLDTIKNFED